MTRRLSLSNLHSKDDVDFIWERLARLEQLQKGREGEALGDAEEEWFRVHQQCFGEVIERLPACGLVLAHIKGEYEKVMNELERSLQDAEALSHRMHVKSTEMDTIRNYHHRCRELEVKMENIKADNKRIEREIGRMRKERATASRKRDQKLEELKVCRPQVTSSRRRALGLSIEEATDLTHLQKELQRAKLKLEEEKEITQQKYVSAQRKVNLQSQLKKKEELVRQMSTQNLSLGVLLKRLTVALEGARTYGAMLHRQQIDPSRIDVADYIIGHVGELVTMTEEWSDDELEDPTREREAEMVLDCLERFNELFEGGRYEEAALLAANSPKGVLRIPETLQKFKSSMRFQPGGAGGKAPILSYCEALMQSAGAYRAVSLAEALVCAQCVLEQGEPSQLAHWIVQESLPTSAELGTLIFQHCKCSKRCACGCKSLAYAVFRKCGAKQQSALCLVHQGRFASFLTMAQKSRFTKEDYESLLYTSPILEFAQCLVSPPKPYSQYLTVFEAMHLMLRGNAPSEAVSLLEGYLTDQGIACTQVVLSDTRTSWEVWQSLLVCLQKAELNDLAVELLALLTVRISLSHAVERVQQELAETPTSGTRHSSEVESDSHLSSENLSSLSGSGYSSSSEGLSQSSEEKEEGESEEDEEEEDEEGEEEDST